MHYNYHIFAPRIRLQSPHGLHDPRIIDELRGDTVRQIRACRKAAVIFSFRHIASFCHYCHQLFTRRHRRAMFGLHSLYVAGLITRNSLLNSLRYNPFTRYNRLSNRFDNRLYRVNGVCISLTVSRFILKLFFSLSVITYTHCALGALRAYALYKLTIDSDIILCDGACSWHC